MTPDSESEFPQHIAIIMDGNNRWAQGRNLAPKSGHRHGPEAALEVANSCVSRNIPYLTLFAFSSENWVRPIKEVRGLMALFLSVLKRKEINQLHEKNVRLKFIGNRSGFSEKLQSNMADVEKLTQANTGTTIIIAADYGGRWDIANAAKLIAEKVVSKELDGSKIDGEMLHRFTSLSEFPDPDLCIRTGGERRISNFLLWQFAYTEFYFTECYWPDFNDEQFQLALDNYSSRQRRFGGHNQDEANSSDELVSKGNDK